MQFLSFVYRTVKSSLVFTFQFRRHCTGSHLEEPLFHIQLQIHSSIITVTLIDRLVQLLGSEVNEDARISGKQEGSGYDQGGHKEDGVGLGFYPHLGQGGAYLR